MGDTRSSRFSQRRVALAEHPSLTVEDIRACCLYASENLPGRKPPWKFEGSFLDSDEWELVEGDEEPTLKSLFENE